MHEASVRLFEEYRQKYAGSVDMALAETIQAIALLGLSRDDFFSHAAFYGGPCPFQALPPEGGTPSRHSLPPPSSCAGRMPL